GYPDLSMAVNNWNKRPFPYREIWSPCAIQSARLGMGDATYSGIKTMFQKYQTYANGLGYNWNGNFEFNGTNSAAINESLMQSYDDKIRIFPALPNDTNFVSKFTLLARGGFLVSSEKEANEIKYVGIKSLYGNKVTLQNPWGTQAVQVRRASDNEIVLTASSSELSFNTQANAVYIIERTSKPLGSYTYQQLSGIANQSVKSLSGTTCKLGSGTGPSYTPTPSYTSTPIPTQGPRSAFSQIEAEDFNSQSGIQSETCNEGGQNVGYIENGDYAVYNNINFGSGATSFQARVSSGSSGGDIEIRLDSVSGPLVGKCSVSATSDWQTWTTASCNITGANGTHDLYLKFTGGSGYLFNMNWWKFGANTPITTSTPTSTPTSGVSADLNHDGVINMADVILLATKFGAVKGGAGYIEEYDLNRDGAINMADVLIIALKFNAIV
ncbi:MAG: carbohydrate-binding protein, partial [Bacillota bacterium]|nr:carbohydrate-binding protein [Bacillota bacterium]